MVFVKRLDKLTSVKKEESFPHNSFFPRIIVFVSHDLNGNGLPVYHFYEKSLNSLRVTVPSSEREVTLKVSWQTVRFFWKKEKVRIPGNDERGADYKLDRKSVEVIPQCNFRFPFFFESVGRRRENFVRFFSRPYFLRVSFFSPGNSTKKYSRFIYLAVDIFMLA